MSKNRIYTSLGNEMTVSKVSSSNKNPTPFIFTCNTIVVPIQKPIVKKTVPLTIKPKIKMTKPTASLSKKYDILINKSSPNKANLYRTKSDLLKSKNEHDSKLVTKVILTNPKK